MGQKIERDHQRFRKIVRGKVKSNLGKYISRGEMIGKKGKDLVSIPLPQIEIPQFRFGQKGSGGVGQGDGQIGQSLGPGQQQPGSGAGDVPSPATIIGAAIIIAAGLYIFLREQKLGRKEGIVNPPV